MATSKNPLLKGFSGQIGKTIVVKQYPGDRTIITAYPDMSKVKPTAAQLAAKSKFADAVAYAQNIKAKPELKMLAEKRLIDRTGTLYHALIKEFMQHKT
ncbi:hypothetical protein [Pedobacter cryophilus]|uniref:Uncharacterized protein n=1 Tax=Pedobacter cryophilus TaxID=2571271 RepID=A0A4U1C7C2_9SPHI|nr:hypothetical protein [Pedobacter cryophilus]TKC00297.1 hypothetical protein FA046_01035 [Pedobacter cryophilus]